MIGSCNGVKPNSDFNIWIKKKKKNKIKLVYRI